MEILLIASLLLNLFGCFTITWYDLKIKKAKYHLSIWQSQQGHDRCWYYPEIFRSLCEILDVECKTPKNLPPEVEFEKGCQKYRDEEYYPQKSRMNNV